MNMNFPPTVKGSPYIPSDAIVVVFPPQVAESAVSGVYKGTVVRGESDIPSGELRITDCHDTVIYILAPLQVRSGGEF